VFAPSVRIEAKLEFPIGPAAMRTIIACLSLAGVLVSSLALQVHYSTATEPCSINERWDCGIVNHSSYAVIFDVPVAAIGDGNITRLNPDTVAQVLCHGVRVREKGVMYLERR